MIKEPLNIILTGASGMVGEGILLACLANNSIESVLSIVRKPTSRQHPKLKELVVSDFLQLDQWKHELKGYDACFYAAGKTSLGMKEDDYHQLTYTVTLAVANVLHHVNPDLVFCFVSGAHTDATETGKVMWARIKGKTENALTHLFQANTYHFRPALMKPMKGQTQFFGYNYITHKVLYPVMSLFYPGCSLEEIAKAMIVCSQHGFGKQILEVKDIRQAASSYQS